MSRGTGTDTLRAMWSHAFADGEPDPELVRRMTKPENELPTALPLNRLQRLIEPEEIANMCVHLASSLASATTGAAVRVHGEYVDAILP